jgi:hypothetical protein
VRDSKATGPPSDLTKGAPREIRSAGERDHFPKASRKSGQTQDRGRRHGSRRGPPESVVLAQLRRLLRHRRGNDLRGGLDAEIFATLGHYALSSLSAEKRGQLWEVTLDDRLRFDLRSFLPIDRSRAQMRAISADNKAWLDLVRKRKRRAKERERKAALSNGDLDVLEEDLYFAADKKLRTISSLMAAIGDGKAWRRPDGSELSTDGLRQAMHRAADALMSKGMIEEKYEVGATGLRVRLIRRTSNTARRN